MLLAVGCSSEAALDKVIDAGTDSGDPVPDSEVAYQSRGGSAFFRLSQGVGGAFSLFRRSSVVLG
jgi:hypothetical protein